MVVRLAGMANERERERLAVPLLFWLFLSSPPACVYSAACFGCERVGVLM